MIASGTLQFSRSRQPLQRLEVHSPYIQLKQVAVFIKVDREFEWHTIFIRSLHSYCFSTHLSNAETGETQASHSAVLQGFDAGIHQLIAKWSAIRQHVKHGCK